MEDIVIARVNPEIIAKVYWHRNLQVEILDIDSLRITYRLTDDMRVRIARLKPLRNEYSFRTPIGTIRLSDCFLI